MYYIAKYDAPIGRIMMASDGQQLKGVWLEGQKYFAKTISGAAIKEASLPVFNQTRAWLTDYFVKKKPPIQALSLAPDGSEFQKVVWDILCRIPYGEVITYGEIAQQVASQLNRPTMSAQAVGGAVGHNPISIIIPCHRVVGANRNLTGYAGGIEKKQWLLAHEAVDITQFKLPSK